MHNKHELASRINDDTANRCLEHYMASLELWGKWKWVGEVEVGGGGGGGGSM